MNLRQKYDQARFWFATMRAAYQYARAVLEWDTAKLISKVASQEYERNPNDDLAECADKASEWSSDAEAEIEDKLEELRQIVENELVKSYKRPLY